MLTDVTLVLTMLRAGQRAWRPAGINYSLTAFGATPTEVEKSRRDGRDTWRFRVDNHPQPRWITPLTRKHFSPTLNEVQKAKRRPFGERRSN